MTQECMKQVASLSQVLQIRAKSSNGKWIFLKNRGREEVVVSYETLHKRAQIVAHALSEAGCKRGDRVILLFNSGPAFLEAFFGCFYLGAIAVPLNPPRPNRKKARFHAVMENCEAKHILTDTTVFPLLQSSVEPGIETLNTETMEAEPKEQSYPVAVAKTDLAFLQYTSGSTGTPKGVMISHGNILANIKTIHDSGVEESDVFVNWLPFFHDMGLIFTLLTPLYSDRLSVHLSPAEFMQRPATWLKAIDRYKGTIAGGPNFAFEHCVNKATPELLASLDLSHWRAAFTGSEPIRSATLTKFAEAFQTAGFHRKAFYPCYGLAEATLFATGGDQLLEATILKLSRAKLAERMVEEADQQEPAIEVVECGTAVPNVDIAIVDPKTNGKLGENTIGEIWLAGPSNALGYWKQPHLTQQTFHNTISGDNTGTKYLATGDLGFHVDGKIYITGRIKDLMIIRGRNYFPADVEATVSFAHEDLQVDGCAAFSFEKEGITRLGIAQEIKRGRRGDIDVQAIGEAVRRAVSQNHDLQLEVLLLLKPGTLPKTSSGKIQRNACQQAYLAETLPFKAKWPENTKQTPDVALENPGNHQLKLWLQLTVANHLGLDPEKVDPNQPLALYGMDSPTALSILGDLEKKLDKDLSPTLIYEFPTISDLANHLSHDSKNSLFIPPLGLQEPVAVVGMSCRFPGAKTPQEFWDLLVQGRDSITEVPASRWNIDEHYDPEPGMPDKMITRWGGFVDGVDQFDAELFNISDYEAENMDPQQRLLLETAWQSLEDSGFGTDFFRASNTGVFVGIAGSDYGNRHALREGGRNAFAGLGSASSIAANRISWQFDLRGPSVAIDTACSSSLYAIDRACKSLQEGECSAALVGAVNLVIIPEITTSLSQAGMMSPDGRCKAFDAGANGYVRSEGCAMVLLKPLSVARRDGSNILGVIRGSAVNQDGRGNGMTAPNGRAQKEVILTALSRAGLEGKDVQYLEAHGTGTSLGDPIEMEALKSVLLPNRQPEDTCWVGSCKTNIGHTEIVAGFAGFIKVLLAMKAETLPKHLHLNNLNPHINIEDTAIKIVQKNQPWPKTHKPRIAGVSSFGIGGTNAHVILEEPPKNDFDSEQEQGPFLLPVSARSKECLEKAEEHLQTALTAHENSLLGDIARTLQNGRRHFANRSVRLITALKQDQEPKVFRSSKPVGDARIAFLFPGQGSQFPGMGAHLEAQAPVYQTALNRCLQMLHQNSGIDLKPLLSAQAFGNSEAAELLKETRYAQPALFCVSYATAMLWLSRGIQPKIMIGHSVGELVAACLAGVFELPDALRLIAKRGELMFSMPAGSMLAVSLSSEALEKQLPEDVSIAAVNGPTRCVVSGETRAIEAFQQELDAKDIAAKLLVTSHAFHSEMMVPILEPFKQAVAAASPKPPQKPFISNVSGTLITAEQATDPNYWAEHLRRAVQFETGVRSLEQYANVFLEVGPGKTLLTLAKGILGRKISGQTIASMGRANQPPQDQPRMEEVLAQLWVNGAQPNWETKVPAIWKRVSLPTLEMNTKRHWVDVATNQVGSGSSGRLGNQADWFYVPRWQQLPALENRALNQGFALVFDDGSDTASLLINKISAAGNQWLKVSVGETFEVNSETGDVLINPACLDSHRKLVAHLKQLQVRPAQIFHFWLHQEQMPQTSVMQYAEQCLDRGFFSLVSFMQAWEQSGELCNFKLMVLTQNVFAVEGADQIQAAKMTVVGPTSVIGLEYPDVESCHLDVGSYLQPQIAANAIFQEACREKLEGSIAVRGKGRWQRQFIRLPQPEKPESVHLRIKGTYLITGGLGGVGRALALYLAEHYQARLTLVSRSELPEESTWGSLPQQSEREKEIAARVGAVQAMRDFGAEVQVLAGDITDEHFVRQMVDTCLAKHSVIHGLIHAAGIAGDGMIRLKDQSQARKVLAPKLFGTLALEAALDSVNPEFVMYCSSIFALTGEFGQSDYCAANAFLDALAEAKDQPGSRRISVNWGTWRDAGMAARMDLAPAFQAMHQRQLKMGLREKEGGEAFRRALDSGQTLIAVCTQDLVNLLASYKNMDLDLDLEQDVEIEQRPRELDSPYVAPENELEKELAGIISELTGVQEVGREDSFFELGGDSLIAAKMFNRLKQNYGVAPNIAGFYEDPTIKGLAGVIDSQGDSPQQPELVPVPRNQQLPLSFAQHRLWFSAQTQDDSAVFNLPSTIKIQGPLDPERLRSSYYQVTQRHEALRTRFLSQDGVPYQVIEPEVEVAIHFSDFSEFSPEVQEKKLLWIQNEEAGMGFDISKLPLFRMRLVKLADNQHVLFSNIHHIVFDGWSEPLCMKEWVSFYKDPTKEPAPLKIQYADYAAYQRTHYAAKSELSSQETWWKAQVQNAPKLMLPADRAGSKPSGSLELEMPAALYSDLKASASKQQSTVFAHLMAAYMLTLFRYSGQRDLILGTDFANRQLPGTEKLIGFFVNPLPIRVQVKPQETLAKFAKKVRQNLVDVESRQDTPFNRLVELSDQPRGEKLPLLQSLFVQQSEDLRQIEDGDFIWEQQRMAPPCKFETAVFIAEHKKGLKLIFTWAEGIFEQDTVVALSQNLLKTASLLAANPQTPLSELETFQKPKKGKKKMPFALKGRG